MMTLEEYMRGKSCEGHKPVPTYSRVGDQLSLYFDPESGYAEPLNESVTLIRAFSDKRVVGVKITGILNLVNKET